MSHKTLMAVAVGIVAGYFLADKLANYQPWQWGFAQGAKFGTPKAS